MTLERPLDVMNKQDLEQIINVAKFNNMMKKSACEVIEYYLLMKEEYEEEMKAAYWDTLMSARPNCWD